jgi:hypothetical protein
MPLMVRMQLDKISKQLIVISLQKPIDFVDILRLSIFQRAHGTERSSFALTSIA